MPSFEVDFIKSKGAPIKYKDLELIKTDRISVQKNFSGTLRLISTNSDWRQAVCLRVLKGRLEIDPKDKDEGEFLILWENFLGKGIHKFEGSTNDSKLFIYNAWEEPAWTGIPFTNYWQDGAAMIVEVDGNTRRYRCNDGHPDENFDDIVYEITPIKG